MRFLYELNNKKLVEALMKVLTSVRFLLRNLKSLTAKLEKRKNKET